MDSLARPLSPSIHSTQSDNGGEPAQHTPSPAGLFGRMAKQMGATLARLTSRGSREVDDQTSEYASVPTTDATPADVEQGAIESDTDEPAHPLLKSGSLGRIASTEGGGGPVCLICLDPLTTEDYDQGEAIQLQCKCRGDLAMRHKTCAARWAGHKGDNVCDICKEPIHNLPEPIVPERDTDDEDAAGALGGLQLHGLEPPTSVDMVFDCIRVMWVAMIICILFFEMDLSNALWTGVVVGLGYNVFSRLMWRSQLAMAQAHLASAQPTLVMVGDGRVPQHGQLTVL